MSAPARSAWPITHDRSRRAVRRDQRRRGRGQAGEQGAEQHAAARPAEEFASVHGRLYCAFVAGAALGAGAVGEAVEALEAGDYTQRATLARAALSISLLRKLGIARKPWRTTFSM